MPDTATVADTTNDTAAAPASTDATPPTPDVDALHRELSEARKENARYRTELKKLQDAQKAADDQQLSDLEKATKRATELEALLQERDARDQRRSLEYAAVTASARLGFANPDDAIRFIDPDKVTWEDGRPTNIDALVGDVLKQRPYLKATHLQPPDLGQGNRGRPAITREQLSKLSESEINARWDEVQAVLRTR